MKDIKHNITDEVFQRISELEFQNRVLAKRVRQSWRITLAAGAIPFMAFMVGWSHPVSKDKVIEAEQFLLRDKDGKLRGGFCVDDTGVGQTIVDAEGITRISMGLNDKNGSHISIYDNKEKIRLSFDVSEEGRAGITVYGKNRENPMIDLSIQPDGAVVQTFIDNDNKPRIGLVVDPEGEANISLLDKEKARHFSRSESIVRFMSIPKI